MIGYGFILFYIVGTIIIFIIGIKTISYFDFSDGFLCLMISLILALVLAGIGCVSYDIDETFYQEEIENIYGMSNSSYTDIEGGSNIVFLSITSSEETYVQYISNVGQGKGFKIVTGLVEIREDNDEEPKVIFSRDVAYRNGFWEWCFGKGELVVTKYAPIFYVPEGSITYNYNLNTNN